MSATDFSNYCKSKGLSISQLSRDTGVSRKVLYSWFDRRRGLIDFICSFYSKDGVIADQRQEIINAKLELLAAQNKIIDLQSIIHNIKQATEL